MKTTFQRLVLIAAVSAAVPALADDSKFSISVEGGYLQARDSTTIPYAYNNSTGVVYADDLGNGSVSGITFGMGLTDAMNLSVRFRGTMLQNDALQSVGSGACNIGPTQGLINDCWDAARFNAETSSDQIDVAVEFPMNKDGSLQFTPYVGGRILKSRQDMATDYYYNGGVSNYITTNVHYNGYGLLAGVKTRMGLNDLLFLSGNLNVGKLWGSRNLTTYDYEIYTPGGTLSSAQFGHLETGVDPLTAEIELALGFDLGENAPTIEVGYQGNYTQDVIEGRNTNTDGAPAGSVGSVHSLWEDSLFVRASFAF